MAHRPYAGIEIQLLANTDVETAKSAANGRREGPFNRNPIVLDGLNRFPGKILAVLFVGLLARVNLHPGYSPLAAVAMLYGFIENMP